MTTVVVCLKLGNVSIIPVGRECAYIPQEGNMCGLYLIIVVGISKVGQHKHSSWEVSRMFSVSDW